MKAVFGFFASLLVSLRTIESTRIQIIKEEGASLNYSCEGSAWIKFPGKEILAGSFLRLGSLRIQESGVYECHDLETLQSKGTEDLSLSTPIKSIYLQVEPRLRSGRHHLRIRRSTATSKEISVKVNGKSIRLHCTLGTKGLGIDVDMKGESERYSCLCKNCDGPPMDSSNPIGFAPVVSSPQVKITPKNKETVYLTCNAKAEPMPVFTWYKISEDFDDSGDIHRGMEGTDRIQQSEKHAFLLDFIPQGFQSKLEITDFSPSDDVGAYLCLVKNSHGMGISIIRLEPQAPRTVSDSSANSFKTSPIRTSSTLVLGVSLLLRLS